MTFGPAVGNVGMYVAREMLVSVPEGQRQAYLRMVEEISDLKYQLGVEVARQLPRLLAEHDPGRVERYLHHKRGGPADARCTTRYHRAPALKPHPTLLRTPCRLCGIGHFRHHSMAIYHVNIPRFE